MWSSDDIYLQHSSYHTSHYATPQLQMDYYVIIDSVLTVDPSFSLYHGKAYKSTRFFFHICAWNFQDHCELRLVLAVKWASLPFRRLTVQCLKTQPKSWLTRWTFWVNSCYLEVRSSKFYGLNSLHPLQYKSWYKILLYIMRDPKAFAPSFINSTEDL